MSKPQAICSPRDSLEEGSLDAALISSIRKDLKKIGLTEEVDIVIRPYAKTYYGKYMIDEDRIILYPFADKEGNLYPYSEIFKTAVHEMVHHLQYKDPSFSRIRGIMHNAEFFEKYGLYILIAKKKGIL